MRIDETDFNDLIFWAFRYALGRSTYVVSDVAGLILMYKDNLNRNTLLKIKEEIKTAIKENKAGMDIDVAEWSNVLDI